MKYKTFFKNSSDAMLVMENSRFADCNAAAVAMLGFDRKEEVLHMTPARLSPEFQSDGRVSAEKAEELIRQAIEQGCLRFEWDHLRKDGTGLRVEVSLTAIPGNDGTLLHTVWRDITMGKQIEAALCASEERLHSVFRVAPIGIGVVIDRVLIEVNERMCEMTGFSQKELIGQSARMLYLSDEDHEHVGREKYGQVHDHGTGTVETRWRHKDGHGIDVLLGFTPLDFADLSKGVTFTALDITERKQAEEALRETTQRLQHIVDNTHDVIFQIDLEGNYIYCNPAAETLTGYSVKQFLEMNIIDLVAPEYHAEMAERLRHRIASRTGNTSFSFEMICKNGNRKWLDLVNTGVFDAEGTLVAVQGVARDITEHKRIEEAVQESEARFRGMFENIGSGVAIYKAVEDGQDFVFVDFNPAGERIEKIAREDVVGKRLSEVFPPTGEVGVIHEVFQRVWRTGKPEHFPVHFYTDERVEEWRENHVYRIPSGEIVAVYDDLTAQKQAERERERLSIAIEQLAEYVVITDAEGTIQYVNPAFERITGYAREEAIGQNPRILKSGEQDAAFYEAMWKTLTEGITWIGRFSNRKKSGALYTEEATISPVKDSEGKIVNYVAIKADITDELIREEQYRQTQKMESIGRLAGGVAHDFNNILQVITGFCSLILAEMDARSVQRKDVVEIQKAARIAGDLTQQLLAFSREQPVQYAVIDLNKVLSDGEKMLRQSLDEGFQLQLRKEPRLELVNADISQIMQIALNLIVNARDAMPDGGTIILRTENIEIVEKDLSDWPGSKIGKWVSFSVLDPGCGMDEKQMTHLFEPFYTTKPLGKGTGLGLSVVYGIVEEHGGWTHVDSKPGKGSTFRICLPVHGVAEAGGAGLVDPEAFKGKRILLVEDDPVIRDLTAEILRDVGYAMTVAENVREVEQVLAESHGEFDLLLSDVMLPDGNGIGVAAIFLKQYPRLPVLLFSGTDDPVIVAQIKEKGFGFVRKPFNLKKLLDRVDRAITSFHG